MISNEPSGGTQDDMLIFKNQVKLKDSSTSDQNQRHTHVCQHATTKVGQNNGHSSCSIAKCKSADSVLSFVDAFGSPLSCHAIRIGPGEELRKTLVNICSQKKMKAAFVLTCVGSSRSAKIRLANATSGDTSYLLDLVEPLEIISLSGTLSEGGHLHISLADQAGRVRGGHLIELIVNTTAEVVIGECTALVFERVDDKRTGFKELVVQER